MKTFIKLLTVVFAVALLFTTTTASAQDAAKTNPNNTKVLSDTLGVKMVKVWWKPGQEMALHTHPVHELYVIKGGQLTVSHKGGTTDVLDLKAGDSMAGAPEIAHTTKNTGKTDVEIILVEITPQAHMH